MAATGTVNSRTVANVGNQHIVYGTVEVDAAGSQLVISGEEDDSASAQTGAEILWCLVTNTESVHGLRCMPNSSNGTAGNRNGAIYCVSAQGTKRALYVAALRL